MITFPELFVALFEQIDGRQTSQCLRRAREHAETLTRLSDEELIDAVRELISVPKLQRDEPAPDQAFVVRDADLGKRDAQALALAAEAFARFPPMGLPPGSRLYEQQLLAAAQLLRGRIVQMDTGEGKTFALSTAALALLRVHARVYVVTANPYLAARDVAQTGPLWSALGIKVGLALPSVYASDPQAWSAQVVYTTVAGLAFRSLAEDLGFRPRTLVWSAVLLDEADAILLDQSVRPYTHVRSTNARAKDWSEALRIAQVLDESDISTALEQGVRAVLTAAGEARALSLAHGEALDPMRRLLLLHDVELAYVATHLAQRGHDYEVRGTRVVTIDRTSGWETPGINPVWVPPLEQHLGLLGQPREVIQQETDALTVLRRFEHLAGASGTVIEEALDYVLQLGLPPARVLPRTPRQRGRLPDLYATSRERAHRWVVEQVAQHGARRPILIATGSMPEAFEIAAQIEAERIPGVTVRAVSGKVIAEERLFERAGRPGVTIVSTRIAGRGVDIPLASEARDAGGAMLLAVGHAEQGRLDRQLLGRVGRCGQPYSARFISHPDDALFRRMANARTLAVSNSLAGDTVLESRAYDVNVAFAQRAIRRVGLQRFAGGVAEGAARSRGYEMLRAWRAQVRRATDGSLSEPAIAFFVNRYLATRFPALSSDRPTAFDQPSLAVAEVARLAGRPQDADQLALRTVGQLGTVARAVLAGYLTDAIVSAQHANEATRERVGTQLETSERAVVDLRLLRFLRELRAAGRRDGGVPTATQALHAALGAHAAADAPDVSSAARRARLAELDPTPAHRDDADGDGTPPPAAGAAEGDFVTRLLDELSAADGRDPSPPVDDPADDAEAVARAVAHRLDPRWRLQARRSMAAIADETIDLAAQRLNVAVERTRFRLGQTTAPTRFTAAYCAEVDRLHDEIETTLAAEMCANLVAGRAPQTLDALFSAREAPVERRGALRPLVLPVPRYDLAAAGASTAQSALTAEALARDYVTAVREREGEKAADESLLYPAFSALLPQSEVIALTDPDRVASVHEAWRRSDQRRRLSPWRRREVDQHVKAFLAFLHERGVAAPLPKGVAQRSRSWLRRARRAIVSPGAMLAAMALLLAGVATLGLAVLPALSEGVSLGPALAFADQLLTAGTLAAAAPLAPALLALVGGAWLRWLLGASTAQPGGAGLIERVAAVLLLVIGVAFAIQPWGRASIAGVVGALGLCLLLLLVGLLIRNATVWFEQMTSTHVTAGLAAAFAAFAALPFLARLGDVADVALIVGVTAALLIVSAPLRRVRIPAIALHVDDRSADVDALGVPLLVRAHLTTLPHAFALLLAWAVGCLLVDGGGLARSLSAGAAYLAVLAFLGRGIARSATGPGDWHQQMRQRQQAYQPTAPYATLDEALGAARRRLLLTELAVAAAIVAWATFVTVGLDVDVLSTLPFGMAAIFCTVAVLDLGRAFTRSLTSSIPGTTPATSQTVRDQEQLAQFASDVVRHSRTRLGIVVVSFVVLSHVADVRDVIDLLRDLGEWVIDAVT